MRGILGGLASPGAMLGDAFGNCGRGSEGKCIRERVGGRVGPYPC